METTAIQLDAVGAAWSSAYATWVGAIANFAVVALTLWLATRDRREARDERRNAATQARRAALGIVEAAKRLATSAASAYSPDLDHPDALSRMKFAQDGMHNMVMASNVATSQMAEGALSDFVRAQTIVGEMYYALSDAASAQGFTATQRAELRDKLQAWASSLADIHDALPG